MQRLKLRAVVLRSIDYGESDRVVSLFSLERGKVSVFARGARASRRRFAGALEPFTCIDAEVRERRSAELFELESAAVARAFAGIRADLARIACAGYACELVRELVRDGESHPDLFSLLDHYLGRLDSGPAKALGLRAFELGALRAAGLMPRLDACARCGKPLPDGPGRLAFDPAQGGLLCGACTPAPGLPQMATPETVGLLARLQRGGFEAAEAEEPSPGSGVQARDILSQFIECHLGKRLASRRFFDELGPFLSG